MPDSPLIENTLLVSTLPSQQLTFYADDPVSHEQPIRIFNQYEFPVKFRVLVATADNSKYTIDVPQSHIKAQHYVEIKLAHKAVNAVNIGVTDKIRVQLLMSTKYVMASGKKDLLVTLLPTCEGVNVPPPVIEPERFHQLQVTTSAVGHLRQNPMSQNGNQNDSDYVSIYQKIHWSQVLPAFFLGAAVSAYYFLYYYLS